MLGRSSWRFFIHFNLKKKENKKKTVFNANLSIECYLSWLLNWYWQINFAWLFIKKKYFLTLRVMNMIWLDFMETLIRCGPWQKMLCQRRWRIFFFQTDFFVLLYKINWVLEALSYVIQWDLCILSINR